MDKLLHERLREHEGGKKHFVIDEWGILLNIQAAHELADEIERCYIPRPRFEDGEPVQLGDEAQIGDLVFTVKGFRIFDGVNDGLLREWDKSYDACFCKRPAPKVLDADGVPCKRGETVFRIEGDWRGTIEGFEFDDNGEPIALCDSMKTPAKYVTHEQPVFDAEGVRICKGDTVYLIGHGNTARTVEEVVTDKPTPMGEIDSPWVKFVSNYNSWDFPSVITHREPDSLERIKADRELTICEYNAKYQDAVTIGMENHILDRAIALIERGA